ncbi:hypothetical protein MTR67_001841, partial [Solanum verrucosum]
SVWISHHLGVFTSKLGLLTRSLISNSLKLFILAGTMVWPCVEEHL